VYAQGYAAHHVQFHKPEVHGAQVQVSGFSEAQIMRHVKEKTQAKRPQAATDALAEAWAGLNMARKNMKAAGEALGKCTPWAGLVGRINRVVLQSQLDIETIIDEIKEIERAEKKG